MDGTAVEDFYCAHNIWEENKMVPKELKWPAMASESVTESY